MSIVLKMVVCWFCSWMSHLVPIVVYTKFAWNYASFNSNDYFFMKTTHILKPQSYAQKLQKLFLSPNHGNSKMALLHIVMHKAQSRKKYPYLHD